MNKIIPKRKSPGRQSPEPTRQANTARLQLLVSEKIIGEFEDLLPRVGLRSKPALFQYMVTMFWRMCDAFDRGQRVMLVDQNDLQSLPKGVELMLPLTTGADYKYLVHRSHPWRKQLYIKGRNMPAGLLARHMEVEGLSPAAAAAEAELPVEAVHEAAAYYRRERALIDAEFAEERQRLSDQGLPVEP